MNTPWGKSDSRIPIERGVSWVSTPSHGGLAVAKGAQKRLTPKAIEYGNSYGGYLFYEEDCAYAIAFMENPQWKRALEERTLADWDSSSYLPDSRMGHAKTEAMHRLRTEIAKTDEEIRADMRVAVARWFPSFLN